MFLPPRDCQTDLSERVFLLSNRVALGRPMIHERDLSVDMEEAWYQDQLFSALCEVVYEMDRRLV